MSDEIKLSVTTDTITAGLRELERRGTDLRPVMEVIGDIVLSNIEDNFANEGRYSDPTSWRGGSKKWKDLSAITVKRRGSAHPILQVSGQLAASIHKEASSKSVIVGTNKEYAAAQQFGVLKTVRVPAYQRKGEEGNTQWVKGHSRIMKLPPRPFMTVSADSVKEIQATIGDYLLKGQA
jgi:phage gpG-like protein